MRDTAIIRRERSARTGPDGIEFKLNRIYLRIIVSLPLFSLTTRNSFAVLVIFGTFLHFPFAIYNYVYIFSVLPALPRNKSFAKSSSWRNLSRRFLHIMRKTSSASTHATWPEIFTAVVKHSYLAPEYRADRFALNCVALRRNALRVI